jgi:hypothetical protein
MGFDEQKLEKLRGPMEDEGPRITAVRSQSGVRIGEVMRASEAIVDQSLDEISCGRVFAPHAGWVGHVEQ